MATREERIQTLATTLKSSGIAKADSQARMMAEEMIGVEDNVQKRYDEEHAKAREFLDTAKYLGTPKSKPASQQASQSSGPIQPIPTTATPGPQKSAYQQRMEGMNKTEMSPAPAQAPVHTDNSRPALSGNHMLNAAMEEIKKNAIAATQPSLEDQYDERVAAHEAQFKPTQQHFAPVHEESPRVQQSLQPSPTEEYNAVEHTTQHVPQHPVSQHEESPREEQTIPTQAQDHAASSHDEPSPTLDTNKLVELMEEDGKLEEHTREIKEKPKIIKPKEEYAENNVDLGNVFNFGKR